MTAPPNGPPAVRANASGAVATATPQASAGYRVTCALRQEGSLACGDGRCALAVQVRRSRHSANSELLYTYTWKSDKAPGKSCVQLSVALRDGSIHTRLFQLR